ncbi:helix-turn-helix domain-containing protein [Achromobacter xylosoxidans]|uniref:helix-turn-helix domain-containing protein n=1 Tax=Alcaligenes xylosoxydans xylosoxydans TaxID=85698 RepID=UPI001EECB130|nr:helix-turn-helix transcriptional regulator [Achromobacter xylosoxidans]
MTIKDEFAEKLRLLRAERGLSQIDLATQAGIAPAQLSRYELGKSYPRAEVLAKLADALGIPRRELAIKGPERGVSISLPMDLIAKLSESAAKRLEVNEITREELSDEVRIRLEETFDRPPSAASDSSMEVVVDRLFDKLRHRLDTVLVDALVTSEEKEEMVVRVAQSLAKKQAEETQLPESERSVLLKNLDLSSVPHARTPKIPGQNAPKKGLGRAPKGDKEQKD